MLGLILEFMECDACRARPGMPVMCEGCRQNRKVIDYFKSRFPPGPIPSTDPAPVPMLIWCPECGTRHIDEGDFATTAHHTHACQSCGHVWRIANVPTVGVHFLPGFKNKV